MDCPYDSGMAKKDFFCARIKTEAIVIKPGQESQGTIRPHSILLFYSSYMFHVVACTFNATSMTISCVTEVVG
jgi:hypothetical protein